MKTIRELREAARLSKHENHALRRYANDDDHDTDKPEIHAALKKNTYKKDRVLYRGGHFKHEPGKSVWHHPKPFSVSTRASVAKVYSENEGDHETYNHIMKIHVPAGTHHVNMHKFDKDLPPAYDTTPNHEHLLPAGKLHHTGKVTKIKKSIYDDADTHVHHYRFEPHK